MNGARRLLLSAYRWATWPERRYLEARLVHRGACPWMVLFYHRVADSHPNPWTIDRAAFARQIDWISHHFEFVSLAEGQRRAAEGHSPRPCVSLTFDDGYAENCEFALPMLLERQIPLTYFVTHDNVAHGRPFRHDVEQGTPLEPNTPDQLRALARAGVEIGAHGRTHVDLGHVRDPRVLADEIETVRGDLTQLVGRAVRYFAFPFGFPENLSALAFRLARESGYRGVCSAYGGYNHPARHDRGATRRRDSFHIRRMHGDPELARVQNWLDFDSRQLEAHDPCDDEGWLNGSSRLKGALA